VMKTINAATYTKKLNFFAKKSKCEWINSRIAHAT
jgi:hypothetical protein